MANKLVLSALTAIVALGVAQAEAATTPTPTSKNAERHGKMLRHCQGWHE
jgi:hypothetical protein